jgi:flagellar protein FlbD
MCGDRSDSLARSAECGTVAGVIQLTRLRHDDNFYLNPDLIERVDTHVDTVVRLTSGSEFVVVEDATEILHRIISFRASIIALSALIDVSAHTSAARVDAHSGVVVTTVADDADWASRELARGDDTDTDADADTETGVETDVETDVETGTDTHTGTDSNQSGAAQ